MRSCVEVQENVCTITMIYTRFLFIMPFCNAHRSLRGTLKTLGVNFPAETLQYNILQHNIALHVCHGNSAWPSMPFNPVEHFPLKPLTAQQERLTSPPSAPVHVNKMGLGSCDDACVGACLDVLHLVNPGTNEAMKFQTSSAGRDPLSRRTLPSNSQRSSDRQECNIFNSTDCLSGSCHNVLLA